MSEVVAAALAERHRSNRVEWGVTVLLLAMLTAIFLGQALFERRATIERERERLVSVTQAIHDHVHRTLEGVNRALINVREDLPSWRNRADGWDLAAQRLKAYSEAMPTVRSMVIFDAQGQSRAIGAMQKVKSPPHLDATNSAYFHTIVRNPRHETLYVSEPFVSKAGAWVINLGKAAFDENGDFDGIVIANLDLDAMRLMLASSWYVGDQYNALIHGGGRLVVGEPAARIPLGGNLMEPGSLVEQYIQSGMSSALLHAPATRKTPREHLDAFKTLQPDDLMMDMPLIVLVGRDMQAVLADWQTMMIGRITMIAAMWTLSVLALWWWQRTRSRVQDLADEKVRQIEQIFESSLILLAIFDDDGLLLRLSTAWAHMLGESANSLAGRRIFAEFAHPDDFPVVVRVREQLKEGGTQQFDCRMMNRAGMYRELTLQAVKVNGYIYTNARDVTEENRYKKQMQELNSQLLELSQEDGLTHLANRRRFDEMLLLELRSCARNKQPLSLILVDIDHFKKYNDHYGHVGGDACLQAVANTLKGSPGRPHDLVARYGGEEFAILLPNTTAEGAAIVAANTRLAVHERALPHATSPTAPLVTLSLGVVTVLPTDKTDPIAVINAADAALYQAKEQGRDRACVGIMP